MPPVPLEAGIYMRLNDYTAKTKIGQGAEQLIYPAGY